MSHQMVVIEGSVRNDLYLMDDVNCSWTSGGLAVQDPSGQGRSIPTYHPSAETTKVATRGSLRPLLDAPIVKKVEIGGGAPRAAMAMAEARNDTPLDVRIVNEAEETPLLAEMCRKKNIEHVSLGRLHTHVGLVVPRIHDCLIVEECSRKCRKPASEGQLGCIRDAVLRASAVACVAPKDWFVADMVFSCCNGGRKYFQPTGSLPRKQTLRLARAATDLICNFAEIQALATWANVPVPQLPEDAQDAPRCAADLLSRLRARDLAGALSGGVTLGRHGSVFGDWKRGRVYRLAFKALDERAVVGTPVGAGDTFLGAMILFNHTWVGDHLRDPVMASALRATQFVATKLGLQPDWYRIDAIRM